MRSLIVMKKEKMMKPRNGDVDVDENDGEN